MAQLHQERTFLSFKGGSISNLHLHLRRKHAEHLDEQSGALIKNSFPDPVKNIEKVEFFKNDNNVKKLIELVRQRGNILYKFSRDNLWNSETQEKLWKEVAEALGSEVTQIECRQCWRNLRCLYDLYKRDPKTSTTKFIDQLKFLESLYARSKTSNSSSCESKKNSTIGSEQILEETVVERFHDTDFEESGLEDNEDSIYFNEASDEIVEENIYLEEGKHKFTKNKKETLSFYKSFDEMDDLDFFLGFLNKKMRTLLPEEKSFVEMKFTQLIFEAEAGLLQ
ncbi:uncharacterized protein LOC129613211 isoform X2 [Condylostylus longicornis]|uniref:uncharacterized protein LOC129613211 isoform X2 n=1 Tax=Condylostylus longicornis TaxID=2530218 RepID=UPI00244DFA7B|nr:uncharacterized protein LOC129613211 isoform X2 [Condylostylus longicornis]